MKQIVLVAETGSDINPVLAAEYNIKIVPMHVSFDHETMEDGAFPVEKIVDYYEETGKLPKTSGSTPGDFETAFDRIHAEYPDAQLLYLAYSAVTTCSMQSAVLAAEERDYVTILDTKQVSVLPVRRSVTRTSDIVEPRRYQSPSIASSYAASRVLPVFLS